MPTSIRELVNVAIFNKLQTLTATIPNLKVERERDQEVESYPFITFYDVGQDADDELRSIVVYRLRIDVEMHASGATGAAAATALNELVAAVTAAMTANDVIVAGSARDVREQGDVQELEMSGSKTNKAANVSFTVEYQTRAGDPYTAA